MKNPNPNIQPGMALEKASRGRSNMRVAVIVIVLAHVALFSGILFNACSQKSDEAKESQKVNVAENNQLPALPPPDGAGGTPAAGTGPATGGALPGAGGSNLPLPVPPGGVAGGATSRHSAVQLAVRPRYRDCPRCRLPVAWLPVRLRRRPLQAPRSM